MRFTLYLLLLILIVPFAYSELDYFSERMNFPPGESRIHKITITNNGNSSDTVNMTMPAGFANLSSTCTYTGSYWTCFIPNGTTRYIQILSPDSGTEGTVYKAYLTGNNSFSETITFVCLPDNKITDCKVEYGHGDANYLSNDQLYISNETTTIFNLVRVWNIGQYLSPNEDAHNASINCTYENYPVRTYGRVELTYGIDGINGSFYWDEISGGYWFRIGVVSQELSNFNISEYYNVSCTDLTYDFSHTQVIANSSVCNLEIRSQNPFTCTVDAHPTIAGKSTLIITNSEKYSVYDVSFDKLLDGVTHTETYQQLDSANSVSYVVDDSSVYNTTIFFIPSWYINSFAPMYYSQLLSCVAANMPPALSPIGNQSVCSNSSIIFDVNASDVNGDVLLFYENTTLFEINSTSGGVNFMTDLSMVGNHSVEICVNDTGNLSDCKIINIEIQSCLSCSINAPTLYVTLNSDLSSVDLNWTDVSADYYEIYISTDPNNFSLTPNVTGITGLSWTDYNADLERQLFYKVASVSVCGSNVSFDTGCKYTYDVIASGDHLKGKNLVTLACNTTIDAESFLSKAAHSSYLTRLNRWDNPEIEYWESHPIGSSVNNYSLSLGVGYLMFVTQNDTFTITGYAINNPINLDLISSGDSLKGKNLAGLPYSVTGHTAETFMQGTFYGSYITRLNRWTNPEIEYWESHPTSSTVNDFTMVPRGLGYLMFMVQNESYTPT